MVCVLVFGNCTDDDDDDGNGNGNGNGETVVDACAGEETTKTNSDSIITAIVLVLIILLGKTRNVLMIVYCIPQQLLCYTSSTAALNRTDAVYVD